MTVRQGKTILTRLLVGLCALLLMAGAAQAQFVEPDVTVLTTLTGESPGDGFGWVGESIGDINNDGASDYVVTAPFSAEAGPGSGKAYVYSGADGSLLNSVLGTAPAQRFGWSVAAGQDLNGDGVNDYVIGGAPPFQSAALGRVAAYSGADHSMLWEVIGPANVLFAYDLHMAGDVNGDGKADVLMGIPVAAGGAGRVDVLSGPDGSLIWSQFGNPGDLLGFGVGGLEDLNGDNVPDQAGSALGAGAITGGFSTGAVYVMDGATGGIFRTLNPNGSGFSFGQFFVHNAGDVDADGVGDIYVGDFGDIKGGRGYVFSGDEDERLRLFNAENASDGLGMGRGAGDIDGDGHDDLLIGAYLSSEGAFQAGKCWVFSGKNGRTLRSFTSTVVNAQIGFDVARLEDVNSDGLTDFLLTGQGISFVVAGN